ncbi:MAG: class I SAM-dependent methyltransferase [Flavobacteriales bacterium]|nr:class I SAM-dependent methyltransferase [Flavobacteriales bacterium]
MRRINVCPICSSGELSHHSEVIDHSISKEKFTLSQCLNCDFLFTNPQPKAGDLWKYYESVDYVSHSKTSQGFINYWYRRVQKLNLQLKYNALKYYVPRGTWLDYGAGGGDFVRFISQKRINIIGLEPSETARINAHKDGIKLKPTEYLNSIENESLACITLWHVLEHIHNFQEVVTSLLYKLQSGGLLVFALPNHLSYDSQIYGANWAALDVPRHLWHFTQTDIQNIATQHSLTLVKTKGMLFDSFYVSLLSEKYQSGSKIKGFWNGLVSNLKASKEQNPFSSQIYVLRK